MWTAIIVALIAALPPTIMAYVAWTKMDVKADEIKVMVDGNLTKVTAELATAAKEIAALKRVARKR